MWEHHESLLIVQIGSAAIDVQKVGIYLEEKYVADICFEWYLTLHLHYTWYLSFPLNLSMTSESLII